ncbi:MAG: hypothetical protein ACF8XB_09875 [Planctomycetota bacterium JB042]
MIRGIPLRSFVVPVALALAGSAVALAPRQDPGARAFSGERDRKSTHVSWYGTNVALGQANIDYGPAVWKDAYDALLDDLVGSRWRLGADDWTTLDTNMPLVFDGLEIAPGEYYLAVARDSDGAYELEFLDPDPIRRMRLDAAWVDRAPTGPRAPLEHDTLDERAERLRITLSAPQAGRTGWLLIEFGPHELSIPVETSPGPGK